MKIWHVYLAVTIMWVGWAVFQLITGPAIGPLIFDITFAIVWLGMTLWARHNDRIGGWDK